VGLKLPVERVLKAAGFLDEHPLLRLYRTEAEALQVDWGEAA
jgi:SulP family sulfate permease